MKSQFLMVLISQFGLIKTDTLDLYLRRLSQFTSEKEFPIQAVLEYHGVVVRVPRKGWSVKYKGEDVQVAKDDITEFIKERLEYFAEVADGLGGIALIPNEDDEVIDSSAELAKDTCIDEDDVDETED